MKPSFRPRLYLALALSIVAQAAIAGPDPQTDPAKKKRKPSISGDRNGGHGAGNGGGGEPLFHAITANTRDWVKARLADGTLAEKLHLREAGISAEKLRGYLATITHSSGFTVKNHFFLENSSDAPHFLGPAANLPRIIEDPANAEIREKMKQAKDVVEYDRLKRQLRPELDQILGSEWEAVAAAFLLRMPPCESYYPK